VDKKDTLYVSSRSDYSPSHGAGQHSWQFNPHKLHSRDHIEARSSVQKKKRDHIEARSSVFIYLSLFCIVVLQDVSTSMEPVFVWLLQTTTV
jgi:hypothetical protein